MYKYLFLQGSKLGTYMLVAMFQTNQYDMLNVLEFPHSKRQQMWTDITK